MIVATNNQNKLKELKKLLSNFEVKGLEESGIKIEVEENQDTFYGNAIKKAKEIYEIAKKPVIADDSGLCIPILDDWPGVLTHRFLGEEATEQDRNLAIIEKMKDYEGSDRIANFVCNLVYYDGKDIVVGEGIVQGKIAKECRGENHFGFDEIFELENGKTYAELSNDEKNKISARSLAILDLKRKLENLHIV